MQHGFASTARPDCKSDVYFMLQLVKGLSDERQEPGLVFVFPEALFSSSLSPCQLVAAGGEALWEVWVVVGGILYIAKQKSIESNGNLF